ncbi:MAG: hypothetical protein R2688_09030 [Fimbriimonadaceae bacterium]
MNLDSQAGVTALREMAEQSYATGAKYRACARTVPAGYSLDPKCEVAFRRLRITLHALNRNQSPLRFRFRVWKPQDVHSHVGMGLSHGALGEDNLAIRWNTT